MSESDFESWPQSDIKFEEKNSLESMNIFLFPEKGSQTQTDCLSPKLLNDILEKRNSLLIYIALC